MALIQQQQPVYSESTFKSHDKIIKKHDIEKFLKFNNHPRTIQTSVIIIYYLYFTMLYVCKFYRMYEYVLSENK